METFKGALEQVIKKINSSGISHDERAKFLNMVEDIKKRATSEDTIARRLLLNEIDEIMKKINILTRPKVILVQDDENYDLENFSINGLREDNKFQINESTEQLNNLRSQLEEKENKINELTRQLGEKENRINELTEQLEDFKKKYYELEEQLKVANEKLIEMKQKYEKEKKDLFDKQVIINKLIILYSRFLGAAKSYYIRDHGIDDLKYFENHIMTYMESSINILETNYISDYDDKNLYVNAALIKNFGNIINALVDKNNGSDKIRASLAYIVDKSNDAKYFDTNLFFNPEGTTLMVIKDIDDKYPFSSSNTSEVPEFKEYNIDKVPIDEFCAMLKLILFILVQKSNELKNNNIYTPDTTKKHQIKTVIKNGIRFSKQTTNIDYNIAKIGGGSTPARFILMCVIIAVLLICAYLIAEGLLFLWDHIYQTPGYDQTAEIPNT